MTNNSCYAQAIQAVRRGRRWWVETDEGSWMEMTPRPASDPFEGQGVSLFVVDLEEGEDLAGVIDTGAGVRLARLTILDGYMRMYMAGDREFPGT